MASNTNVLEFSYILKQRHRKNMFFLVSFLLIIFALCSAWLAFVLFPTSVRSDSMNPTLQARDVVFVTPLAVPKSAAYTNIPVITSLFHSVPLQRGDLVYVKPLHEIDTSFVQKCIDIAVRFVTFQRISPFSSSKLAAETPTVRRLVGLPGDVISMKDFVLYVTEPGQTYALTEFELIEAQYDILIKDNPENWDIEAGLSGTIERYVLGEDEYFLLADNRSVASDSCLWGAVPAEKIGGKVVLRYWPFNRFSLF